MKKRMLSYIAILIILTLVFTACGSVQNVNSKESQTADEMGAELTTETETFTEDITTTEVQTEAAEYEIPFECNWGDENISDGITLVTSRAGLERYFGKAIQEDSKYVKYDEKWFESKVLVLYQAGSCSCCALKIENVSLKGEQLIIYHAQCKRTWDQLTDAEKKEREENAKEWEKNNTGIPDSVHNEACVLRHWVLEIDRTYLEMLANVDECLLRVRDIPYTRYMEGVGRLRTIE